VDISWVQGEESILSCLGEHSALNLDLWAQALLHGKSWEL
jgi:hypothetical protein